MELPQEEKQRIDAMSDEERQNCRANHQWQVNRGSEPDINQAYVTYIDRIDGINQQKG